MNMKTLFDKYTTTTETEDRRYVITCNRGLWGVDAPTLEQARKEAMHYFALYLQGGEYADKSAFEAREGII